MDYLAKLIRLFDAETTDCWEIEQHTQELIDTESSMRIYWDDEASRTLWSQYAYPQNEDATRLIAYKKEMLASTQQAIGQADMLFQCALTVFAESEQIALLLKEAEIETDASALHIQTAGEYAGRIRDAAPGIDAALALQATREVKYESLYSLRRAVYVS